MEFRTRRTQNRIANLIKIVNNAALWMPSVT